MDGFNEISIERVASTILNLLGCDSPLEMAPSISEVVKYKECDRVFMYNPDAIAEWIYEAYRESFAPITKEATCNLEMLSVYPPVTPVCFASMYSGLEPNRHGIMTYTKPVLKCTTIFDLLPESGKKCAIVSTANDSISEIFLNRNIDYFIYKTKEECNKNAMSLIKEDKYDLIVLYNGNYDWAMHRFSPEGRPSIKALKENIKTYCLIREEIKTQWKGHKTALAFAPDHGCHRMYKILGTHGERIAKDMNIRHFWTIM